MSLAELCEVPEEAIDLLTPWLRLEHVMANEVVEPLDVLDGHRLIQDFHRLRFGANRPSEPTLVLGKRLRHAPAAWRISRMSRARMPLDKRDRYVMQRMRG